MSYAGGKDGAGIWQRAVNQIPPHDIFISAFAGDCAVSRHIRPAAATILIDRDAGILRRWETRRRPNTKLVCADAMQWLRFAFFLQDETPKAAAAAAAVPGTAADFRDESSLKIPAWGPGSDAFFRGLVPRTVGAPRVFAYLDPPYLPSTRSKAKIYRHEMTTEDHARLLDVILRLPCHVLIHGYPSAMYSAALWNWRTFTYRAMTRGGLRTEQIWANYQSPAELHDYGQVGANKRQRERIRRRCKNWTASLARAGAHERGAILQSIMPFITDHQTP
jgi:DNA adenine methylase